MTIPDSGLLPIVGRRGPIELGVMRLRSFLARGFILPLAISLATAVSLSACGEQASAGDIEQTWPTFVPTAVPNLETVSSTAHAAKAPPRLNKDDVRVFFENFEDVRSGVIFEGFDVAELERHAAPVVVADALAEREGNRALVEGGDLTAVVWSTTFENLLGLDRLDESLAAFTSCSEVHDELVTGEIEVRFVDHRVVFDASADPWRVIEHETRDNGTGAEDEMSCVAPGFVDRALAAIDTAIPAADAALANPASASAVGLHEIFGGRIEEELKQMIAIQAETQMKRVSTREFHSEVIGLDPSQPDFMIVVSVCSYYPDGVIRESATGERTTVSGYEPGMSEEDWLYVWLEPIQNGNATVAGIKPAIGRDCWESR